MFIHSVCSITDLESKRTLASTELLSQKKRTLAVANRIESFFLNIIRQLRVSRLTSNILTCCPSETEEGDYDLYLSWSDYPGNSVILIYHQLSIELLDFERIIARTCKIRQLYIYNYDNHVLCEVEIEQTC